MEKDFEKYKTYTNETFSKYDFEWNKKLNIYRNKEGKKCLNEFEKEKKLGMGSSWKVYKVKRYYYDDQKQIKTKLYALKKTHIMVQYKRRYYKDQKLSNYFEKILEEIEIMGILNKNEESEYIISMYELIYDNEGENKYYNLYLVNNFCDIGTIMNRDSEFFNHYHNPFLIKYFYPKLNIELENFEENLIKKNFISLDMKHSIAKKIFKQVYLGVKYIHSHNIAHRDIKIENILFDSNDDKIKIIDFSISTIVKSENKLINEPGGSMHYQSPEFFDTDKNGYYNPFIADIWAIGISLYIFIFEEFPFDAESELELGINICEKPYKFPYDPKNKDFEELLSLILEKDLKKRKTDIDEILNLSYFK